MTSYIRSGCLGLLILLSALSAKAEDANYYLVTYFPGSSWNEALAYEDQPGLSRHHEYLRELYLDDILVMGGPVTDGIVRDTLSMMLLRTGSLEEANQIMQQDPGIQMHLIDGEVTPWSVNMSSMRFVQRRQPPTVTSPDQSFSIKRIDPESRINISD